MRSGHVAVVDSSGFGARRRSGSLLLSGMDAPGSTMEELDLRQVRIERSAIAIPGSATFSYHGVATVTTAGTVAAETASEGSAVKTTCTNVTGNVAEIVFPTFTRRQFGPSVTFLFYTALLNSRKIIGLANISPGAKALNTTNPSTVLDLANNGGAGRVRGVGFVSQYRITNSSNVLKVPITVNATAKTFTRTDLGPPAGSFIVDGWRVGDTVTWNGTSFGVANGLSVGNEGANVITALEPTVMTFGGATTLVSESKYGYTNTGTEYLKIWGQTASVYTEITTDFQLSVGGLQALRVSCMDVATNTWAYDAWDSTNQRWRELGDINLNALAAAATTTDSGFTKTLALNAYFQIVNSDWRDTTDVAPDFPGANSGSRSISVIGIRHR